MNDVNKLKEELNRSMPWTIGLVITKRKNRVNVCPVTFQVVSSVYEKPLVVCIGLSNDHYSLETVALTHEFVYAYPSVDQLKDVLYCGTVSGRTVDKLKNTTFSFTPSRHVASPQLKGAVANFECRVISKHTLETFTIVIGKILTGVISDKQQLDKIYALGNTNYGIIKQTKILKHGRV